MIERHEKSNLIYLFGFILLCIFLIYGTGIIGDDYSIPYFQNSLHMMVGPVNYLVREGFYKFAESRDYVVIDIIKSIVLMVSLFGFYSFFSIFHRRYLSLLLSFAIIYFPIHDAVTYWYTGQGYILSCAFYFYAYFLLSKGHDFGAVFFAIIGSFMGYGSPPFAAGVAYLAYRQLGYRASLLMLLPNVFYVVYYLVVTKIFNVGIDRVSSQIDLFLLFRNFLMQMGTAVDALVGPSAWFKMYYSIMELSASTIAVLFVFWFFVVRRIRFVDVSSEVTHKDVAGAFFIIMLVSWTLFASTGFYPQTAFNLGDRVTFWGTLLTVYLILTMAVRNKIFYSLLLAVILLGTAGISEHWKNWHIIQKNIASNIKNNVDIKSLDKDTLVFVSGNGYSKLGPFAHLEFFAVESYASSIFKHALGRSYDLRAIYIGDNLSVDSGIVRRGTEELVKDKTFINVYDPMGDKLEKVTANQFENILKAMPKDNRHWIQIYGCGSLNRFIEVIAPRYKNLCKT